jgi:protein SCO1/2
MTRSLAALCVVAAVLAGASSCSSAAPPEPPKKYALTGQVLAINAERQELTVKHDDIPGFMPAMTMTYPVFPTAQLEGRTPGELIAATLEVQDYTGRLTEIRRTGTAPLPSESEVAMAAGLLSEGDEVPDVALIDQNDQRRSISEWRGHLTLITFIYTNCPLPTYCPLMDQNFATLQRAISEDSRLKGQVRLVSVTFDPETDTPQVLATHAARLKADPAVWTFLTGDRVTIHRFAGRFGVSVLRPDGEQEINHNLRTALVGRDGRVRKFYSGTEWTPSTVLNDFRSAASAP